MNSVILWLGITNVTAILILQLITLNLSSRTLTPEQNFLTLIFLIPPVLLVTYVLLPLSLIIALIVVLRVIFKGKTPSAIGIALNLIAAVGMAVTMTKFNFSGTAPRSDAPARAVSSPNSSSNEQPVATLARPEPRAEEPDYQTAEKQAEKERLYQERRDQLSREVAEQYQKVFNEAPSDELLERLTQQYEFNLNTSHWTGNPAMQVIVQSPEYQERKTTAESELSEHWREVYSKEPPGGCWTRWFNG